MGKLRQGGARKAGLQDVRLVPSATHPHARADKPWVCPVAGLGCHQSKEPPLVTEVGMDVDRVRS